VKPDLEREDYYIKLLKPEYNILQKAGSSLGIKRSDETRAKMSLAKKGENHPLFRKKNVKIIRYLEKLVVLKFGKNK